MADETTEAPDEGGTTEAKGNGDRMIPSHRLREEADAKRAALARVAELEGKLAQAEQTWGAKLAQVQAEHETDRSLWQSGITDPRGLKVARLLYADLPEAERPALAEWAKTEPALSSFRAQVASTTQTAPAAKATGAAAATTGGASATAPVYTPEQLREIRERAERTRDWSEWDKARPFVLGRLAGR